MPHDLAQILPARRPPEPGAVRRSDIRIAVAGADVGSCASDPHRQLFMVDALSDRFAQYITAPPDRFDIAFPGQGFGQLLAQLADEDIDDLEFGFVHPAVKVVEKHLLFNARH